MAVTLTALLRLQTVQKNILYAFKQPSMPSTFNPSQWILVADTEVCPYSKRQIELCKQLDVQVKGVILCNDKGNAANGACLRMPAFPAFCHVDKGVCVSGLRETAHALDELQRVADSQPSSPSPRGG